MSSTKHSAPASHNPIYRVFALLIVAAGVLFSAQAPAQETTAPDYQIAAEDVLDISVWREPDLQKQVIVRPDGGISMPLVGNIQAAGLTTEQLETVLAVLNRFQLMCMPNQIQHVWRGHAGISVVTLKGQIKKSLIRR